MILSHRIQIAATKKQEEYFSRACGTSRFVWNWALEHWNRDYEDGGHPRGCEIKRQFNAIKYQEFPWLSSIHRDAHSRPFENLQKAFVSFFNGMKKRPVFKKKGRGKDSFYISNDKLRYEPGERFIRATVIGKIKLREPLRFVGRIMSATVSRTADRWYISIAVDVGDISKSRSGNGVIGVDLGVVVTATCSDGQKLRGPRPISANSKKMRRASRRLSRKKAGSSNKKKLAVSVAKLHAKIASARRDWINKTTTKMARENQAIYLEDLSVASMMKNKRLSRAILDSGWPEMARQLAYKMPIYGGTFTQIDRWFPSSKTCRKCGLIKDDLTLSQRVFNCDGCGHSEDRDLNAAHNICTAGLAGIYAHGPEGSGIASNGKPKPRRVEVRTKPRSETNAT